MNKLKFLLMSDQCLFPLCSRHAQKNGYCVSHAMYAKSGDPATAKQKPAKATDKAAKQDRVYKKMVKEMLTADNKCEMQTPECTLIAEGLHHMKRRGQNLMNKKYLKRSCNACNRYVEKHPAWALENGLSVLVHAKEN